MNYLSVCAICKDEAPYIEEWIKYHGKIGVEHFYLYENESKDNTWEIINSFNYVTANKVSGTFQGKPTFKRCLKQNGSKTRWMAFIDIDEFIVPHYTNLLQTFLADYEAFASVGICRFLFGSNNHTDYSAVPVIERFTRRSTKIQNCMKSIVQPAMVSKERLNAHRFKSEKSWAVNEHKMKLPEMLNNPEGKSCDLIQINHYAVKSKAECLERRGRPQVNTKKQRNPGVFFQVADKNEVEDLRALELWRAE